jgi:hypothetical protein
MMTALAGMTVRADLLGVTSMVRALGLRSLYYDRLLDLFHSSALNLDTLTRTWRNLVFQAHPGILRIHGRPVLVGDGLKVAKAGRKMPAVKRLHQESESNTKPEYIFGHSCQAVAVLAQALLSVFAIPLTCRIHEGVVLSNRDKRTLLDKMILLIDSLGIPEPFYFVADAYYGTGRILRGLLAQGNHLVTRVKSNAVAWYPATPPPPGASRRRGRPRKYGHQGPSATHDRRLHMVCLLHDIEHEHLVFCGVPDRLRFRPCPPPLGDRLQPLAGLGWVFGHLIPQCVRQRPWVGFLRHGETLPVMPPRMTSL